LQNVCDRLDLTRDDSQRQLPTDHDYAVSTREYQLDQSSPLPASAAADLVFERQRQKTNPRIRGCIDRVTHIHINVLYHSRFQMQSVSEVTIERSLVKGLFVTSNDVAWNTHHVLLSSVQQL
jgi:hypothetical protein